MAEITGGAFASAVARLSRSSRSGIGGSCACGAGAGDGVDAKWIVYGKVLGDQKVSILRLTVSPGAKTTFRPDSPTLFHTNGGSGRVGKLEVGYHQNMKLGEIYPEIGFITQAALSNDGVEIENTGSEPLVLTFDFPQNAHSHTPGVTGA